jgi:pectate lyase
MKRLTNIFTLLVLMLGMGMNVNAQTWDFATLSANDQENLEADTSGDWGHNTSSNDRWGNKKKHEKEPVKANGVELEYTKGLLLTFGSSTGEGNFRADIKNRRAWIAAGSITIPALTKGSRVTVSYMSSSKDVARGISVTNLTPDEGSKFGTNNKGTASITDAGTVTEDGDVTLTMTTTQDGSNGMYLYLIKVEDASDDEEGGDEPGGGDDPAPTTDDYSTSANSMKNQALLTLTDGTTKYYNTESLSSIDFDGAKVIVMPANTNGYTFDGTVAGISFKKAESGQEGEVINIEGNVEITEAKGWLESAYVKFKKLDGAKTYNVYVKGGQYTDWMKIDRELVRDYGTYGRADVVGLKAASDYAIKVVPVDETGTEKKDNANEATNINVKNYSRQGFAFMNNYTPGAYNADGTLKSGAKVLYITKNTAKTVTTTVKTGSKDTNVTEVTGFQAILDAYQKGYDTTPIAFRFIGMVSKDDLDAISSSEEGIQIKGKKADAEMPLTIEGIGDDGCVKGFGFLVRNSKGVEFRNIGVIRCMDDGISMDTDNSNIWVHHTDIFYGKSGSGDHGKGDGATDVKADSKYVTVSYNRYWDTGKTNMFGMKSESGPNYISYDHNWFDHSDSRHPRVRTMTVHVWNNYFDNVAKYGVGATTGSSVFVENNYFLKTKKPILTAMQGTDANGSKATGTFSGEDGGMIKAYGNFIDKTAAHFSYHTQNNPISGKGYDAYETTTREGKVPETEKAVKGGATYNNFDTNASLMYEYTVDAAEQVPEIVTGYYGAGRMNHGDISYTLPANVGSDDTDSAVDTGLANLIDNYKSSLVGIFGDDNGSGSGDEPGGGDQPGGDEPGGGDQPGGDTPEGTIVGSFDGSSSSSVFTVASGSAYYNGNITYNGTSYVKGVKFDSKGKITFTPSKNYNMTIVMGTAKSGRDVKINGTKTTVSGTENTEGKYYELQPIAITANTVYELTQGSAEGLVMLIILEPTE